MFYHNINPVLFSGLGLEIRYYGLMYLLGIGFCYFFLLWWVKQKRLKAKGQAIEDILFYIVLGIIVGGRLGYVLFYSPVYFFSHPLEILKFWEGGLSFHGGLIAVLLFTWLYCRKKRLSYLKYADIVILPVPVALALGRVGNFINGELWGRPTNLPWGFYFPDAPGNLPRHPSQLYEVLKNLIIFASLLLLTKRKSKEGFVFFSFLLLYGALRFIVEFVREPEIVLAGVTMGQWLSIPLIIIGAIGISKTWKP
jgi:phosphatidylglycerol:prolipoprotein diacylglycerol transferase